LPARALNFHGIGSPPAETDSAERRYWITKDAFYQVIDRIPAWQEQQRILITFDDGNASDLEIAAPALLERGLRATFFVLTGRLEQPGYLSADDVRQLRDMRFGIGSHGQDHVSWPDQTPAALHAEVFHSRDRLEQVLGAPVTEAAIPFGNYNRKVIQALKAAKYEAAWTSDGGAIRGNGFLRPRTSIRSDMSVHDVQHCLTGRLHPVREARRVLSKAKKAFF